MAMFRFKFLADYFSDALISGFVCGAATHTVVSQLGKLLGVKSKAHSSYFSAFLVSSKSEYDIQVLRF
jgi:MFS superfamily sulfate permease-like transporter